MQKPKFSGHQTFSVRYGWFEKGYQFIKSGHSFTDKDALIVLGVGKNMVTSIEYWSKLAGFLTEKNKVTELAEFLLNEDTGRDPYLENDASWWIIHWNIVTNPIFYTSGSILFSKINKQEFTKNDIIESVNGEINKLDKEISAKIIERDIDCFLHSYCTNTKSKKTKSDYNTLECPMSELHLIEQISSDSYHFNVGMKYSLPIHVIGYCLWDMVKNKREESINLRDALYDEKSPGQVLLLDENSLVDAINALHEHHLFGEFFELTESAGISRILCRLKNGFDILEDYYSGGII